MLEEFKSRAESVIDEMDSIDAGITSLFEKNGVELSESDKNWIFDYLFNSSENDKYSQMVKNKVDAIFAPINN